MDKFLVIEQIGNNDNQSLQSRGLQMSSTALNKDVPSNNYFDGMKITGPHAILFGVIMLAYFCEQMDNWNFGFIAPALRSSWNLTMGDIGMVNFWYFIGMTTGGFCGGVLSDFIGRRKTFLLSILMFSVCSILNGFTNDFHIFVAARTLTGFGVFCLMVCSQAYIAEMSPAESRGKWQGYLAGTGLLAVPVIGVICRYVIPMHPEAWRYIFYFGGIGLFAFLIGLRYLKESPRWLVAHKRQVEAEQVIYELTGQRVDLSAVAANIPAKVPVGEVLVGMFQRKYLVRTLVIAGLFVCVWPAAFIISNWTATLLNGKGWSVDDSIMATTILSIGAPAGCLFSGLISDMGGRKIPIIALCVSTAVAGVIFGNVDGYWMIVTLGFLSITLVGACGYIAFSYAAESYPTRMRNTAIGFHNGLARLAVAGIQPVIPIIFNAYQFSGVYYFFALLVFLPVLFIGPWGQRTSGKSLESIA